MSFDNYKVLGLIAVTALFLGLVFIIVHWPKSRHATFSQHVASRRQSVVYYALLFSVVLPLLMLFFLKWFIPEFGLSKWFGALIIASSATQYLCVLIPENGGWKSDVHRFLAGVSAVLLVPALTLLLVNKQVSAFGESLAGVGLAIMLISITVVVAKKGQPRNFLILQSMYFISFFAPILVVSYL